MTQLTQEQRDDIQAAGWTEEEATGFAQTLATFRDGLPPRQRDALDALLATAGATATAGDEVQGYVFQPAGQLPMTPAIAPPPTNLVVPAIIAVLVGLLLPAVQSRGR